MIEGYLIAQSHGNVNFSLLKIYVFNYLSFTGPSILWSFILGPYCVNYYLCSRSPELDWFEINLPPSCKFHCSPWQAGSRASRRGWRWRRGGGRWTCLSRRFSSLGWNSFDQECKSHLIRFLSKYWRSSKYPRMNKSHQEKCSIYNISKKSLTNLEKRERIDFVRQHPKRKL